MDKNDRVKELQTSLEECQEVIIKQHKLLQKLTAPPLRYAIVVNPNSDIKFPEGLGMNGKTMTVSTDNGDFKEVFKHEKAKEGDIVLINPETSQVICKAGIPEGNMIVSVKRVLSETKCEVTVASEPVIVFTGGHKINDGDQVILSDRFRIVTGVVPAEEGFDVSSDMEIGWDDIGGLTDVKSIMRDIVEMPYKHPEIFKYYNKRIPKGVLLYGPPGCGKTMIGKAVATSVKRTHNIKSGGFIYVKGPEILSKYVGESESQIRHIFAEARRFKAKTKAPAVIFIDEAESILNCRGSGRSSDVDRTIVPMFLSEMDGMNGQSTIVILATNKENLLDPAAVREGRIDYKVRVNRPDKDTAADIFLIYLRNIPTLNGHSASDLAMMSAKELYSIERPLFRLVEGKKEHFFCMSHIASGSMIAHIVNHATTIALNRDLKQSKKSGLSREDLILSIDESYRQNAGLDHREYLDDFQKDNDIKASSVERVKL